jgi:threonine/homoserine/homoserine lactone efflux protein
LDLDVNFTLAEAADLWSNTGALDRLWVALSTAAVLGLSAGLSPGPMFSLVLAQTLRYGTLEGIKVSLTPLLTDLPIITIAILLVGQVDQFAPAFGALSLAGAVYLGFLAVKTARPAPVAETDPSERPRSVLLGFLANALNPQPYLFWITVGAPLVLQIDSDSRPAAGLFLVAFYGCLVGAKMTLAVIAGRSRRVLGSTGYRWLIRGLAALLGLLALMLIVKSRPLWSWIAGILD